MSFKVCGENRRCCIGEFRNSGYETLSSEQKELFNKVYANHIGYIES